MCICSKLCSKFSGASVVLCDSGFGTDEKVQPWIDSLGKRSTAHSSSRVLSSTTSTSAEVSWGRQRPPKSTETAKAPDNKSPILVLDNVTQNCDTDTARGFVQDNYGAVKRITEEVLPGGKRMTIR